MIALLFGIALIVYVVLAILLVKLIGKFTRSKLARYIVIAAFVLIPTWDILPGRLYFSHLCLTEAGTTIFKTVEVEKSFFKASGQPDDRKLIENFVSLSSYERGYSRMFHIARIQGSIRQKWNDEKLGSAIDFAYYGGWIAAYLFPQGPPRTCPQYPQHAPFSQLWREVIKPTSGDKGNYDGKR